jgi:hypothetical protein
LKTMTERKDRRLIWCYMLSLLYNSGRKSSERL